MASVTCLADGGAAVATAVPRASAIAALVHEASTMSPPAKPPVRLQADAVRRGRARDRRQGDVVCTLGPREGRCQTGTAQTAHSATTPVARRPESLVLRHLLDSSPAIGPVDAAVVYRDADGSIRTLD